MPVPSTALVVARVLARTARARGLAVVAVLHQPRAEIAALLDTIAPTGAANVGGVS